MTHVWHDQQLYAGYLKFFVSPVNPLGLHLKAQICIRIATKSVKCTVLAVEIN